MIYVQRTAAPAILLQNAAKWRRAIIEAHTAYIQLPATPPASKKNAKLQLDKAIHKYQHKKIKQTLSTGMFHDKCAYCEAKITHVSYGNIEHFAPKSKYPNRAVRWRNLLLACDICNNAPYKGNEFPIDAHNCPLLINPCEENPADFLEFIFDIHTKIAFIQPFAANAKGQISCDTYGLNRDALMRHRSDFVRKLVALAAYYHTDREARTLLDDATSSSSEYAAFARMIKSIYT